MRLQIVRNFIAKLIKLKIDKEYVAKFKKEELEQKYFSGYKKKDDIGLIITIFSVGLFLGLIIFGFLNLLSLIGNIENRLEIFYDPVILKDAFYGYFGSLGDYAFVPILNIYSNQNRSVDIITTEHPVIKEFYIVKAGGEAYNKIIYELTQYIDYKFRIIEPEQLDAVPDGSFIIYFGQVLDNNMYKIIRDNNKKLNIIFISSRLPILYQSFAGATPTTHNLFNFPITQNKRAENIVFNYVTGQSKIRVDYSIPDSTVLDFLSYFYDEGRRKMYFFYPLEMNDEFIGGVDKAYLILKLHLEQGDWAKALSKAKLSIFISEGQRFIPVTLSKVSNTVFLYSKEPTNPFFVSTVIYPYSRGMTLAKERFFLPKTEQAFDIKYEPYAQKNFRRDIELKLYNVSQKELATFKIGNLPPKISTEYRRSINLEEGTYVLELWADQKVLLSKSLIVASNIYPKARYIDSRSGRFLNIYFYSFDGSPIYLDNVKFKLPWEDKIREERFVDPSGISIVLDQPLQAGNYTIYFNIKNIDYQTTFRVFPRTSIDKLIFGNPLGLVTIVISILVVVGSNFLRPKPPIIYSIDIPEVFPPIETIEIKLNEAAIRKAFDHVQNYYKWKYIPLSEDEIAEGLKANNVDLENSVIDFTSLSIALNSYVIRGLLKKYRDFYILADWEKESGYSVEQLVMFRNIRDVGLEYGLIYELDLENSNGRIKYISEYGEGIIYLYDPIKINDILNDLKNTISNYREIYILTKDYFDLRDLKSKLYNINIGMLVLEYIRNDRVQLYTLDDYIEKIKTIY